MMKGTKVRMSAKLKNKLRANGSHDHVNEFGRCVGVVQGLVEYPDRHGPEVNVKWLPSNLRYAYHPTDLEIV